MGKRLKIILKCKKCGEEYHPYNNRGKMTQFCSINCRNKSRIGFHLTEEHKKKMSISLKGVNKHPKSKETKIKISLAKKGKPLGPMSYERRKQQSIARMGPNGSNWQGGVSTINDRLRHTLQYVEWRKSVFKRDEYICQICGDNKSGKLNADHIIPFSKIVEKLKFEQGIDNLYEKALYYPLLWDINNGRTLCYDCHRKTETFGNKPIYREVNNV